MRHETIGIGHLGLLSLLFTDLYTLLKEKHKKTCMICVVA